MKLKEYSMSIIYSPQAKAGDEKKSHLPVLLSQRGIDVTKKIKKNSLTLS
jgi:hypothetical protein